MTFIQKKKQNRITNQIDITEIKRIRTKEWGYDDGISTIYGVFGCLRKSESVQLNQTLFYSVQCSFLHRIDQSLVKQERERDRVRLKFEKKSKQILLIEVKSVFLGHFFFFENLNLLNFYLFSILNIILLYFFLLSILKSITYFIHKMKRNQIYFEFNKLKSFTEIKKRSYYFQ